MTNSEADQTPSERKAVFEDYLMYYDQVSQQSNVKVCKSNNLIEKAKHILLFEVDPTERFTAFDFYQTVFESVNLEVKDCRSVLNVFIKAAEVLETICVNLFLFPWKKEIKIIKTFTGPFVYCVQPVLPKNVVQGILKSIGYTRESDTEYRLNADVDLVWAKRMGFELFLARVECEYLLEEMGQRRHDECLELLQTRAAPLTPREARVATQGEPSSERAQLASDGEGLWVDGLEVTTRGQARAEVLATNEPMEVADVHTQTGTSEEEVKGAEKPDRHQPLEMEAVAGSSILEMRQNYPDLAIRQRPIFRKDRGGSYPTASAKARGRLGDDGDVIRRQGSQALATDLSGPQSFSVHETQVPTSSVPAASVLPLAKARVADRPFEEQPVPPGCGASLLLPDPTRQGVKSPLGQKEAVPSTAKQQKLGNGHGKLCVKEMSVDEPLKYPIEETAQAQAPCHDHLRPTVTASSPAAPPSCSPRHQPIMCSPSSLAVCSIPGCHSCVGHEELHAAEGDTIREPPSSLYMPPSPLKMCSLPLEPGTARYLAGSTAVPLSPPGLEARGPAQQPEDDILQTYVLVEPDRK